VAKCQTIRTLIEKPDSIILTYLREFEAKRGEIRK